MVLEVGSGESFEGIKSTPNDGRMVCTYEEIEPTPNDGRVMS